MAFSGKLKILIHASYTRKKMISKSIAQMPMNMDDQSSKKPIAILKRNVGEDEDVQFSI